MEKNDLLIQTGARKLVRMCSNVGVFVVLIWSEGFGISGKSVDQWTYTEFMVIGWSSILGTIGVSSALLGWVEI
jgi:hypothetical protein